MPRDEFKEWLKVTEDSVYCGTCEFIKDGFCTFYNEELEQIADRYTLCPDCHDDSHAEV